MDGTPFPLNPSDVAALTVPEFAFSGNADAPPSLDAICRRFLDDQNRALVWMIRFSALQTWGARSDVTTWLQRGPGTTRDALEVAAGFPLNEGWEFDTERFCSAIDVLVSCRTATPQA